MTDPALTGVSTDDLSAEIKRRFAYYMREWQASYASAQFFREKSARLEKELAELKGEGDG